MNTYQADHQTFGDEQRPMQPPTSPWTEAYQDAPMSFMATQDTANAMNGDSSDTQPTRDALSDIYNRGYSV